MRFGWGSGTSGVAVQEPSIVELSLRSAKLADDGLAVNKLVLSDVTSEKFPPPDKSLFVLG